MTNEDNQERILANTIDVIASYLILSCDEPPSRFR
jgi:hypothetical protein